MLTFFLKSKGTPQDNPNTLVVAEDAEFPALFMVCIAFIFASVLQKSSAQQLNGVLARLAFPGETPLPLLLLIAGTGVVVLVRGVSPGYVYCSPQEPQQTLGGPMGRGPSRPGCYWGVSGWPV